WYSSMFAANIKEEPMSHHHHHSHHSHGHHHSNSNSNASSPRQSPLPSPNPPSSSNLHLEQYLKQQQQHQQQQQQPMDTPLPLTPPGLPNPMQIIMPANMRPATQPTPTIATPTTTSSAIVALQSNDKLQALTPPMDVTPPKSAAKSQQSWAEPEKDHDLMSNSSEDMKYMA
uniref:Protein hunchback (Fragments) n=1 Tax=Scaptomyza albovittata TaxID=7299 RepID=HUNB_SCAAL|nr:RecName: Full=Protein hunchback [Scaptomyza albovittata]